MECPICFYVVNEDTNIPYILKCGHTICQDCLKGMFSNEKIICPTCSQETCFSIPKDEKESPTDYANRCISTLTKNLNLLISANLKNKRASLKQNSRDFKYGMVCKVHNLLIHSYVSKPFSMVCNKCLEEISGLNFVVIPFPQAIEACKNNIEKLEQNLKNLQSEVEDDEPKLDDKIANEVNEHFNSISKRIKEASIQANKTLADKISAFKESFKSQHKAFEEYHARTKINEQRLGYFSKMTLGQLILERKNIENLLNSSKEPVPSLQLDSI